MTATAAYNNHSLVGEALRLLASGLGPYVTDKMREAVEAGRYAPDDSAALGEIAGDISVTLRVMAMAWNDVFRDALGPVERSLVSEIRETRNRWAHQDAFDDDDLDRALDSIGRLLAAVGALDEAKRIDGAKHRLRLRRYGGPSPKSGAADGSATGPEDEPDSPARSAECQPTDCPGDMEPRTASAHGIDADGLPEVPAGAQDSVREQLVQDHILQGVDYRRREHFGHAMGEFEQAIGINPNRADAWFHRGMTWGLMGDHAQAIADFNRAIGLSPQYAEAYNCRGYAHLCLGEHRRAVEDLERADRLNPGDQLIQGNLQQARMRFLQEPGNPNAARYGSGPVS